MEKSKENKVSSDALEREIKAVIEALRKSGTICGTGSEMNELRKRKNSR